MTHIAKFLGGWKEDGRPYYGREHSVKKLTGYSHEFAFAWDTRWQFKQDVPSNNYGSGTRAIEMQKKFDHSSMSTFKGTTDSSNGYTVMRNLNDGTMRGYINKDGTGLLHDQREFS